MESFGGQKNDKTFLKLDELLTRCVLKLDEIDRGDEQVNQTRKKLINFAHQLADRLDEIATRNATAIVPVGDTTSPEPEPKRSKSPDSEPPKTPASVSNLINQFEGTRKSSSSSPKQSTS